MLCREIGLNIRSSGQFSIIIRFTSVSRSFVNFFMMYLMKSPLIPLACCTEAATVSCMPDISCQCINCIYFKIADRLIFLAPIRFEKSGCFAALRRSPAKTENMEEGSVPLPHLATSISLSLPEMKQVGVLVYPLVI